jgi:hypothetical protein
MDNYTFYKYINEKSILVITPKNGLKRLFCPFLVKDTHNNLHNVTGVAIGNDFTTYYLLNGKYCIYRDYIIVN